MLPHADMRHTPPRSSESAAKVPMAVLRYTQGLQRAVTHSGAPGPSKPTRGRVLFWARVYRRSVRGLILPRYRMCAGARLINREKPEKNGTIVKNIEFVQVASAHDGRRAHVAATRRAALSTNNAPLAPFAPLPSRTHDVSA